MTSVDHLYWPTELPVTKVAAMLDLPARRDAQPAASICDLATTQTEQLRAQARCPSLNGSVTVIQCAPSLTDSD